MENYVETLFYSEIRDEFKSAFRIIMMVDQELFETLRFYYDSCVKIKRENMFAFNPIINTFFFLRK